VGHDGLLIGGPNAADRNLIAGGFTGGIILDFLGTATTNRVIQGNYIGTDVTGTAKLASGSFIGIDNAINVSILDNLISAGGTPGAIESVQHAVTIRRNLIGTQRDGVTPLPINTGITLIGANNAVGGPAAADGNVIAFIATDAVYMLAVGGTNTGNSVLSNSIHDIGVLGINLGSAGSIPLPNNDDSLATIAPNFGQNYPVLTSAVVASGTAMISGTLNSLPSNTFLVQFFSNTKCGPSGYGDGETLIGSTNVTTDATGNVSFGPLALSGVPAGQAVFTATATRSDGSTSEFSLCKSAAGAASTTTSLTSSVNPSLVGQSVTLSATVTGSSPTGSVQFMEGATLLGTGALSGAVATFATSALTMGSHNITAAYGGDSNNGPSTSPILVQQIVASGGGTLPPGPAQPIPAVSPFGLALLIAALVVAFVLVDRRGRKQT
jgi:hypothetical protein